MPKKQKKKILLRSNNDYIDHEYWPKVYKKAKRREKKIIEKYGAKNLNGFEPASFTPDEQEILKKQGIGRKIEVKDTNFIRRIPIIEED